MKKTIFLTFLKTIKLKRGKAFTFSLLCEIQKTIIFLNLCVSFRLALGSDFGRDAADAVLDLTGDDDQELRKQRSLMKWDRKKKKFIGQVSFK